jgi:hypothetical protein
MNQFATPGLGSLMGGRIVPGIGQLLLFLLGFAIFILWFIKVMHNYYGVLTEDIQTPGPSYAKFAISGLLFCAASWLWALLTSISLIREAKAQESKKEPPVAPPRITNVPPKM